MSDNQPINCEWHDELEAAAVRNQPVQLQWRDAEGVSRQAYGLVRDIEVKQGEEFLLFEVNGEQLKLRLDWLAWQSFPLR